MNCCYVYKHICITFHNSNRLDDDVLINHEKVLRVGMSIRYLVKIDVQLNKVYISYHSQ